MKTYYECLPCIINQTIKALPVVDKESEIGKKYLAKKNRSKFYNIATFYSTDEVLKYFGNAGFKDFKIKQTVFRNQEEQIIEDGFGKGSFVVIRGLKK